VGFEERDGELVARRRRILVAAELREKLAKARGRERIVLFPVCFAAALEQHVGLLIRRELRHSRRKPCERQQQPKHAGDQSPATKKREHPRNPPGGNSRGRSVEVGERSSKHVPNKTKKRAVC